MVKTVIRRAGQIAALIGAAWVLPSCLDDHEASNRALGAPSNLSGTASADGTTIQLAWADNSTGETGFRVDAASVPITVDGDVTEYAVLGSDATTYAYPTGPNTTRFFRVLAITASQQSEPSNVISVTTPNVPSAPSGVDALVGPDNSDVNVVLSWNDLPTETGYQIERSANGGPWQSLASPSSNVTSLTDTATVLGSEYSYRIRGSNANGKGAWSVVVRAQTRDPRWGLVSSSGQGDASWHTSFAVNAGGTAFIAAYDATFGDVVWGMTNPGALVVGLTPIDVGFPQSLGYSGTSIALDAAGSSHLVANDSFGNTLYYVTNGTGFWVATSLGSAIDSDRALIRIAPEDSPHVIYQKSITSAVHGTYASLWHAWKVGSSWTSEAVSGDLAPDLFAFTVDSGGRLHVSYRRPAGLGRYELVYATRPPIGSWTTSVVPTSGNVEYSSIAVGPGGAVHVVYNELTTSGLHYTTKAGGSWTTEVLHQSYRGSWGRYNSIAVDPSGGEIHVSYYDNLYGALRYAAKRPGSPWIHYLVDTHGDVGRFSSLALDADGRVLVVYGDATNGETKLARSPLQ